MTPPHDKRRLNERVGAVATLQSNGSRPLQFVCECEEPGCHDFVRAEPAHYANAHQRGHYIVNSGHTITGARRIAIGPGYDVLEDRDHRGHRRYESKR